MKCELSGLLRAWPSSLSWARTPSSHKVASRFGGVKANPLVSTFLAPLQGTLDNQPRHTLSSEFRCGVHGHRYGAIMRGFVGRGCSSLSHMQPLPATFSSSALARRPMSSPSESLFLIHSRVQTSDSSIFVSSSGWTSRNKPSLCLTSRSTSSGPAKTRLNSNGDSEGTVRPLRFILYSPPSLAEVS